MDKNDITQAALIWQLITTKKNHKNIHENGITFTAFIWLFSGWFLLPLASVKMLR